MSVDYVLIRREQRSILMAFLKSRMAIAFICTVVLVPTAFTQAGFAKTRCGIHTHSWSKIVLNESTKDDVIAVMGYPSLITYERKGHHALYLYTPATSIKTVGNRSLLHKFGLHIRKYYDPIPTNLFAVELDATGKVVNKYGVAACEISSGKVP